MKQTCTACQIEQPIENFRVHRTRLSGSYVEKRCKSCQSIHQKINRARRGKGYDRRYNVLRCVDRIAHIQAVKSKCGCAMCGEKHPAALDFHHTDPSTKKASVGSLNMDSIAAINAEIAKCIVLCSNCHRKLHWTTSKQRQYDAAKREPPVKHFRRIEEPMPTAAEVYQARQLKPRLMA